MLVRVYEKYTAKTDWLHGFYAISSYQQIGLTKDMDAVSLGWSRMTYTADGGPVLNTTSSGGNVYAIPAGYESAVKELQANGCQLNLSVFMDNTGGGLTNLLGSAEARERAVALILAEATRVYPEVGSSPTPASPSTLRAWPAQTTGPISPVSSPICLNSLRPRAWPST